MEPIDLRSTLTPPTRFVTPRGFTETTTVIRDPVPHSVAIEADTIVTMTLPTGVASAWKRLPADTLISSGRGDTGAGRPPARLTVAVAGRPSTTVPLAPGLVQLIGGGAGGRHGVTHLLVVLDWELRAGTLVGGVDAGSWLTFAWRRADRGVSHFSTPPPPRHLIPRLAAQGTEITESSGDEKWMIHAVAQLVEPVLQLHIAAQQYIDPAVPR